MKYLTRGRANASLSPDGGRGIAMGVPVNIVPPIITRTAPAVIGPYTAGQRPIDAYTPGTYASTAGTIIRTATWRVSGSPVAGTVTLIGAQSVELVESVTDSAGTPARLFSYGPVAVPAIAPTVTVAINQGSIDVGDVLGTDINATATIAAAGSPALLAAGVAISWLVNGAPRAAGELVAFGDVVRAVASWSHPAGAGSVQSAPRTVPAAVAPTVTVALAEPAYTAGQTLDLSDVEFTITSAGYPPLLLGDLALSLRVNGSPVAVPHIAAEGQVLVGRATWSHATGAGVANSASLTVGAAPAIPVTNFAREYSQNIGSVTIDLSTIGPAESGTATYADVGTLPAGYTRSGNTLTINTATASAGTATVRRTDGVGQRDLRLTLALVTPALTGTLPDLTFASGADDPPATPYSFTLTGGLRDGQVISFLRSDVTALAANAARLVLTPLIGFTTDTDSDGQLDVGDTVALTAAAVRVSRAAETPPASAYQWRDAAGNIPGAISASYTRAGALDATVRLRETVGAAFADSATVPVAGGAAPTWSITPGNGQATVVSSPTMPTTPAWNITPGNGQATVVAHPGG